MPDKSWQDPGMGDIQSRPRSCGMLRDSIITLYLRVFIYETSNLMSRGTYRDGVRSPPVWRPPDPYAVPPSGHTKPGIQSPSAGKGILPNCKSGNIYRPENFHQRGHGYLWLTSHRCVGSFHDEVYAVGIHGLVRPEGGATYGVGRSPKPVGT